MYYKAKEQHALVDACRIKDMIFGVEKEIEQVHCYMDKLAMSDYSVETMLSL